MGGNRKRGLRQFLILGAMALVCLPQLGFGASVMSKDIAPADGTTGQTLTTGSGVKTGHIQDNAVSTAKIANGAVTSAKIGTAAVGTGNIQDSAVSTAKIADGAVTSAKIGTAAVGTGNIQDSAMSTAKIADGAVTSTKIGTAAVGSGNIANGAVTDAKIVGPISTSKLNIGTTSGTVSAGDHNHDEIYQKKYANVIVVAKSGGDFTDPIAAINSTVDPSATNRYLITIMPGSYDLNGQSLVMRAYVDVEGAGSKLTTIRSNTVSSPVVNGAADSEIRNLKIKNEKIWDGYSGTIPSCLNYSFLPPSSTNIKFNDLIVQSTVGPANTQSFGIIISGVIGKIEVKDVEILFDSNSDGYSLGIVIMSSNVLLQNVTLNKMSSGVSTYPNSNVTLDNVNIIDTLAAIENDPNANMVIKNSNCSYNIGGQSAVITNSGTLNIYNFNAHNAGVINQANANITSTQMDFLTNYGNANVALTQLTNNVYNTGTVKCYNVYDTNLNPMACQ